MLKATETNERKKTTLEKTNEFALRLQGAFALAKAMEMVEQSKDEMTDEEYAEQIEMIAQIAENLATFIPEG